jgi:hypothetical protein
VTAKSLEGEFAGDSRIGETSVMKLKPQLPVAKSVFVARSAPLEIHWPLSEAAQVVDRELE